MAPLKIKALAQFHAVVDSNASLVITDVAKRPTFHENPRECSGVREAYFLTKVVANAEATGSYFSVPTLEEARAHWPDIAGCRSSACSAAASAYSGEGDNSAPENERLQNVLAAASASHIRPRSDPPAGIEALMGDWTTTQRIALGTEDGGLFLCSWPAELKTQAAAVYATDVANAIVELVDASDDWTARPLPHLAFNGAKIRDRFYLPCSLPLREYVTRWSRPENLGEVRGHAAAEVRAHLWPWLCGQGFVDVAHPDNQARLDRYMEALSNRKSVAHIRPGIGLRRRCDPSSERTLRRDVTAAVGELAVTLQESLPREADLCRGWTAEDIKAAIDMATDEQRRILSVIARQPGVDLRGVADSLGSTKDRVRGALGAFTRITKSLDVVDPVDGSPSWPLEHSSASGDVGPSRYLMPRGAARVVTTTLGSP